MDVILLDIISVMNREFFNMVCSLVLQIVAAIALLTGVASFGLLLLNPYTLIGSFGLSLTGAFVLLTHNNRLRNTLYRAFPQSIRHFLFEKSIVDHITSESVAAKLLALALASTVLPVAETQQLVDQLPPQLAVYKQRSLIDCMPPVLKQTVLPPQRDTAIESAAVPDGADASLVPVESAALPQHAVAATARDGVVATDGFYENLQRIGTNHINRSAMRGAQVAASAALRALCSNCVPHHSLTATAAWVAAGSVSVTAALGLSIYIAAHINPPAMVSNIRRWSVLLQRHQSKIPQHVMKLMQQSLELSSVQMKSFIAAVKHKQLLTAAAVTATACAVGAIGAYHSSNIHIRNNGTNSSNSSDNSILSSIGSQQHQQHQQQQLCILNDGGTGNKSSSVVATALSASAELWQTAVQRLLRADIVINSQAYQHPSGRFFCLLQRSRIGQLLIALQRLLLSVDMSTLLRDCYSGIQQLLCLLVQCSSSSSSSSSLMHSSLMQPSPVYKAVVALASALTVLLAHRLRTSYRNCRWLLPVLTKQLLQSLAALKLTVS